MAAGERAQSGRFREFWEAFIKEEAELEMRLVSLWREQTFRDWRACATFGNRRRRPGGNSTDGMGLSRTDTPSLTPENPIPDMRILAVSWRQPVCDVRCRAVNMTLRSLRA